MRYYCYVYYDENWQGYYVGKGQRNRYRWRADRIPVADEEHTQLFYFAHEWQAWECEIELIAFWGRQCDGGTLLNKSTGGACGTAGCKRKPVSEKTRKKMSAIRKNPNHAQNNMRGEKHFNSKTYKFTDPDGNEYIATGLTEFCRQHNLSATAICGTSTGKRPHHKGWTAVLLSK